jgi:hypothetical protein
LTIDTARGCVTSPHTKHLFSITDEQMAIVMDHAAAVPWAQRQEFLRAVAGRVAGSNVCDGGIGDDELYAACQCAVFNSFAD